MLLRTVLRGVETPSTPTIMTLLNLTWKVVHMKKICLAIFFTIAALTPLANCHAEVKQLGPSVWVAGIPTNKFQFFANTQHCPEWCWAASIQMVLNFHGLTVSQEQIVTRIFGAPICRAGQPQDILNALSGWAPNVAGGSSAIMASPYTLNSTQLVQDLILENPMIVGLMMPGGGQHAVVLTAVTYGPPGVDGNPTLLTAIIRDPWPLSPSRQEIPWPQFAQRITFLAHVYVQ